MLKLRDVAIGFGDRRVFRGLDCDFHEGAISAIKKAGMLDGSSSLLKCCAGILLPCSGDVLWRDRSLQQFSIKERYQALCYCYEFGGLVSLFSVYNNLAIPMMYHQIYGEQEVHERIFWVAEQLGIVHLLELEPFQLNDVQVRLVNLARALVLQAQVILVDEMQTGMSHEMVVTLADILRQQAQSGCTIIMVTTAGDDDSFADYHYLIRHQTLERRL